MLGAPHTVLLFGLVNHLLVAAKYSLKELYTVDNFVESNNRNVVGFDASAAIAPKNTFDEISKINEKSVALPKDIIEGDIRKGSAESLQKSVDKRNALRDRRYLWHNKVVPYVIDIPNFSVHSQKAIREAMSYLSDISCVQFQERTTEKHWILFVRKEGCWSLVGRDYLNPGPQEISIGAGCAEKGLIIHEILHALGFFHEQSRNDRDKYVEIFWENIKDGEEHNFDKKTLRDTDNQELLYDFDSIMHYGSSAFSKDGKITMTRVRNPADLIGGHRNTLSAQDINELNLLYDCKSKSSNFWSSWSSYSPCDVDCVKRRQRYCSSPDRLKCENADGLGLQTETKRCTKEECFAPIDGHWGRWSDWTACSMDCGVGKRLRKRICDDPAPKYGGTDCPGKSSRIMLCNVHKCLGKDDCDFENEDLCDWTTNTGGFHWRRHTGPTKSHCCTGPQGDHSPGKHGLGFYMYTEASGYSFNDRALLTTKKMPATKGRCFSFWYNMRGSGMGDLSVLLNSFTEEGPKTQWLLNITGNRGQYWNRTEVMIRSPTPYDIQLLAVRGKNYKSDIAIDDVSFAENRCMSVERLGCFKDHRNTRAFLSIKNMRDEKLNWHALAGVVERCRDYAAARNEEYFGVEFYGECWIGQDNQRKYYRNGMSSNCYGDLVGKSFTIMVYKRTP